MIGKRGGRGLHVGWRLLKTRGVHSIDCRLVPLQVVFGFVLSNKGVGEGLLSIRRSSGCRGWYRLCITIIFEEGGEKSFGVRKFQVSRRRIDRRTKSYEVVFWIRSSVMVTVLLGVMKVTNRMTTTTGNTIPIKSTSGNIEWLVNISRHWMIYGSV